MNAIGRKIVRADDFLWHLSNFGSAVAVFVATLLYISPGSHSLNAVVFSIDPFYLLVSFSIVYTCWTGIDLWRWYHSANNHYPR